MAFLMKLSYVEYYLIGINAVGLLCVLISFLLGKHANGIFVIIAALIGGAPGVLIGMLLFDRKSEKDNMMAKVIVLCAFVIEIVIFLWFKGYHKDHLELRIWRLFTRHKLLFYYLAAINIITLIMFGIDKINACEKRWRIPIVTLLGLCCIGGSIGGLVGMYAFRHKTSKNYFTVGVPMIILTQLVVIFYIMNTNLVLPGILSKGLLR